MIESQLYEAIGRKQMQLDEAQSKLADVTANYAGFLGIVRGILRGEIKIERLSIQDNGVWILAPVPQPIPKKRKTPAEAESVPE